MRSRIVDSGLPSFNAPFTACAKRSCLSSSIYRPGSRCVSSSSSSASASAPEPPKRRLWLRLTILTATAAGVGAYVRWLQDSGKSTLNPFSFTKYYLVSKEPVSSTCSIFVLKPANADGNCELYEKAWQTGVWSVMFKQPQLQIARDYTPLPPNSSMTSQEDGSLHFLIRRDPHGEVSRYLHALDLWTAVEMRGPQVECEIPSTIRDVLFIAGGTGIAPALQAGYTLLSRTGGSRKPRIHILWASRRREDCLGGVSDTKATVKPKSWFSGFIRSTEAHSTPGGSQDKNTSPSFIVQELEALKSQYPGQITVDYFVDEEGTSIGKQTISDAIQSIYASSPSSDSKLILVSGPDGFIGYMAGPKVWAQGMELQGPLQGVIKELDLKDWAVWKL